MPELPEVEVVRAGMARWVAGRTVRQVEVRHPRAIRRHDAGAADFAARLAGQTLVCASRRGKYLWLPLAVEGEPAASALVGHLGMSGQLLVQPSEAPDEKHLRVRIAFEDGGRELRFVDQRTFGGLAVADLVDDGSGGRIPEPVAHIARDPLDPAFDDDGFVRAVRARDAEIKRILLDQTVASGVGNIYADEALWRGVPPRGPTRAPTVAGRRPHRARRGARGHGRGPGPGGHELRRAVRQRQRRERLLRPQPGGLRAGGAAVPPLRHPHPAHLVHEQVVVLLPALPAWPPWRRVTGKGRVRPCT